MTINSLGPNNDGCNPESCSDVLIERCDFTTGDDRIAIKSGRNFDGRRVNAPSENIVVRDCRRGQPLRAGLQGYADLPITGIRLRDCTFDNVEAGNRLFFAEAEGERATIKGRQWTGGRSVA